LHDSFFKVQAVRCHQLCAVRHAEGEAVVEVYVSVYYAQAVSAVSTISAISASSSTLSVFAVLAVRAIPSVNAILAIFTSNLAGFDSSF
jgi:hypothetical protein